jgi:hypothetical protein
MSTFKTRFIKSPALYNIQEVDNNNNILISDLMNCDDNSVDSISIINGSINYFIEQQNSSPPETLQIQKQKYHDYDDNILNKPELSLLNEVNRKLTIYKKSLLEQSYFYYGNTKQFDIHSSTSPSSLSKFSVSSIFISSQAPLAASECTTLTTNSSYNNLSKLTDLQIFDDVNGHDYINIDF